MRKLNEEQGGFVNLMVWDSEKKNIDGKPIGEYIALMYRNILPNPDCPYSMVKMTPTAYKDERVNLSTMSPTQKISWRI